MRPIDGDKITHNVIKKCSRDLLEIYINALPTLDVVPWEFLERYADHFCAMVPYPEFIREAKLMYADACGERVAEDDGVNYQG